MKKVSNTKSTCQISHWQRELQHVFGRPILLFLLIILLVKCNDGSDEGLDPAVGPAVKKQFGNALAFVNEVSFRSGNFSIFGDLRSPTAGDVHPAIIMIHGSGSATRHGSVPFEPLIEIFLQKGFAVFSWDKPGSGASKGEFREGFTITDRAQILNDAVELLKLNGSIDHSSIGVWGISQAGWVIPKALQLTNSIAFVIVIGGGGEDGIEQYAYQVGQVVACKGGSVADVEAVEQNWSKMIKATTYTTYKEAVDILLSVPSVSDHTGLTLSAENQWNPWPQDIDAFFDPMEVVQHTTKPMLILFGALDKNIDPVQGALAYETALSAAGNRDYTIKVLEGAGHVLAPATTGCLDEAVPAQYVEEYLNILEDWLSSE